MSRNDIIERLRTAYQRGDLTLYLGAGVSAGNGLPSWDRLVLAMYFAATEADIPIQAHPNYLIRNCRMALAAQAGATGHHRPQDSPFL